MKALNIAGMSALKTFLEQHAKHSPTNSIQLNAWANEAEKSDPPYLEIRSNESVSGYPITRSFSSDEYFEVSEEE
jgi:hypothetical protein